ncbi:MAG: acetyl-CoA hydrolase, partial [Paludibacteraceae bacterium]|nr:acetyl-CoA hydrolase [Paludibacteraceae bacterium]
MSYKIMSAEEAASLFFNGANVGFSGFTAAGTPKIVPSAIAAMAEKLHNEGKEFKINVFTGASSGDMLDGALVRANAINFRAPYQSSKDLRNGINSGAVKYNDMHLSHLSQELRYGFYGKLDFAVVEAADVTPDGEILPTAGVGLAPTACMLSDKIIIELNSTQPKELYGMHDIFIPANPPYRKELPIYKVSDRAGEKTIKVDPKKIVAIVESNEFTNVAKFTEVDATTAKIGQNVANFLANELKRGTVPPEFLPIQSGVGNVANAVLYSLGDNKDVPTFTMYTEVIQDAVIDLMEKGRISFASGCSLTTSTDVTKDIYSNLKFFGDKVLLRPIEISNNPEIIRRLGLITINTALEADIFGNVNSTHVLGTKMMNGIG